MLISRRDIDLLKRAENLHKKWVETRGKLTKDEYNETVRIRKHYLRMVIRALGSRSRAPNLAKKLTYLSFAAAGDYFRAYFVALHQLLSVKFKLYKVPTLGGLTDEEKSRLEKLLIQP